MDDVFSTIEKSRKNNKNLSSQTFVVGSIVNNPSNVWSIDQISYIVTSILLRTRRLIELGVFKETLKGFYKISSAAHLQNKSQRIMPKQTFYIKFLQKLFCDSQ